MWTINCLLTITYVLYIMFSIIAHKQICPIQLRIHAINILNGQNLSMSGCNKTLKYLTKYIFVMYMPEIHQH